MDSDSLFKILYTYEGATLTLWNFYIIVSLGLLAYAIGSNKAQEWSIRIILVLAFCGFAWGNQHYIERNQILIKGLSDEIVLAIKAEKVSDNLTSAISVWSTMQPPSLRSLHLLLDAGMVILLLFGPSLTRSIRLRHSQQ